jgi:putative tryptophan/tyrosine transport system substrate-binding protein
MATSRMTAQGQITIPNALRGRLGLHPGDVVPQASRVAVLWNAGNPFAQAGLHETEAAARSLGLQLHRFSLWDPGALPEAFAAMAEARVDALVTLSDAILWNHRTQITELAAKTRLPAIFPEREFAEAGGLVTYGPHVPDNFRRAATYVDKILKGANPGELPIQQPSRFEMVIHLKTARARGLTIAPALLFQADEVIR